MTTDAVTPSPRPRRRLARRTALVAGGVVAALVVVPAVTGNEPEAAAAELVPFGDCDEVGSWYRDIALEQVGPWGLTGGVPQRGGIGAWLDGVFRTGGDDSVGGIASGAAESADAGRSGDAVGPGATGTNVQEEGVDEPDVVKTDGRRVLTLTGDTLHVVGTDGSSLRELGSVDLGEQWPQELLLLGDTALVVGQRDVVVPMPEPLPAPDGLPEPDSGDAEPGRVAPDVMPVPSTPTTVLTVVDVSEDGNPRVVRTEEVEASYLSARYAGGAVRVVLGSQPVIPLPQPRLDESGGLASEREAERANEAAVEGMSGAQWLPHRVVRDQAGGVVERAPVVDCAAVSHPAEPSGLGTVTVLTLDAGTDDLATTDTTAVSADGGMVYASTDRLYVATTSGGWGFPMPIDVMPMGGGGGAETQLHGFDTSDPATTTYVASGSVPGYLLSRWAMSVHDGMLRVATTVDSGESEAVVTVLTESGGELTEVGSVGGLGKTEQIRAVRWFGDLAVVVTFRQTDPLYTVDLSDPTSPQVMGELKIPGYSAYLHPLGEGMLLGVGQDATDEGMTTGTQLSAFDLRDLQNPERLDTLTYAQTWSDVEGESRAFSYLPDQRLALVPLAAPNGNGVVSVAVGEDGALDEAGRWTAPRDSWVLRATPVGAGAVVVLAETGDGRTLTLLGTPDLSERDAVSLR